MTTNADIRAEYLEDNCAFAEHIDPLIPGGITERWPLLVFDSFLHLHCTWKHGTEQYRRYRKWLEEMIVAGVQATEGKP